MLIGRLGLATALLSLAFVATSPPAPAQVCFESIEPTAGGPNQFYGHQLAIDGDVAVTVSNPPDPNMPPPFIGVGEATILRRSGGSWVEEGLVHLGLTLSLIHI